MLPEFLKAFEKIYQKVEALINVEEDDPFMCRLQGEGAKKTLEKARLSLRKHRNVDFYVLLDLLKLASGFTTMKTWILQ